MDYLEIGLNLLHVDLLILSAMLLTAKLLGWTGLW